MIVGSLPDVARSWAEANPALKPGYIAVYDALGDVSGGALAGAVAAGVGFQMSTAFALLLLGLLLLYVVLVASSVRIWVLAARSDSKTLVVAEPVGNGPTL